MFRQMLSCVCVYEYESVGECVSEYKHLCIYTLAHMQELIFEGFASSLGRYFFPPAREGEPEGWAEQMDPNGNLYFYNATTGQSSRQHPLDEYYQNLYLKVKMQRTMEVSGL